MAGPNIVLVDNFDSFTFNVKDYLEREGASVSVFLRDEIRPEELMKYDGVLFSPGPGNPENLPSLMALVAFSVAKRPTFGICLGFQAIAHHYGSRVVKGNPYHGKRSTVVLQNTSGRISSGLPFQFEVVRYHSLGVNEVFSPLFILLKTEIGEVMAIEHAHLNVAGVQFHPEAYLTEFGSTILGNWVKSLKP